MTAGTRLEPWARIAGAMIGGRAPMPGAAPRLARDPQYAAAVQRLDQEGVNAMTAAQRTGNVPMRWIEDATATVPGGGGRAVQMQEQAAQQFTAAALRRAGVNADRATPETLAPAFDALGQEFNQFAGAHNVVPTNAARTRLAAIARDYEQLTPEALRVPYIRQLVDDLAARPYVVGTDYAGIRSSLRRAQRGLKDNPQASYAMGQIVDTMDVALARSAPAGQRGAVLANLHDMNGRYRNLLAIEDAAGRAGEATARGMISPAALKQAVQKQNKRDYTRGRSELGQLARAGETVLKPLRSSGTGERTMAQGYLSAPGAIAGVLAQGGIEGALVGVAAPALAKAGAARAVMSRAGQAMVQNERIMEPMAYDGAAARLAALLAMQPEKERGLRGGTGPRYDALYNNK